MKETNRLRIEQSLLQIEQWRASVRASQKLCDSLRQPERCKAFTSV